MKRERHRQKKSHKATDIYLFEPYKCVWYLVACMQTKCEYFAWGSLISFTSAVSVASSWHRNCQLGIPFFHSFIYGDFFLCSPYWCDCGERKERCVSLFASNGCGAQIKGHFFTLPTSFNLECLSLSVFIIILCVLFFRANNFRAHNFLLLWNRV